MTNLYGEYLNSRMINLPLIAQAHPAKEILENSSVRWKFISAKLTPYNTNLT